LLNRHPPSSPPFPYTTLFRSENLRLVELGPGRGTLLNDALRATKVVGGFRDALVLHLVEINPALREIQEQRLEPIGAPILWHDKDRKSTRLNSSHLVISYAVF